MNKLYSALIFCMISIAIIQANNRKKTETSMINSHAIPASFTIITNPDEEFEKPLITESTQKELEEAFKKAAEEEEDAYMNYHWQCHPQTLYQAFYKCKCQELWLKLRKATFKVNRANRALERFL